MIFCGSLNLNSSLDVDTDIIILVCHTAAKPAEVNVSLQQSSSLEAHRREASEENDNVFDGVYEIERTRSAKK
jgi:hypothetical protein